MDTFDLLTYVCRKRDDFIVKGVNSQDASAKANHAIGEEYHICLASLRKLYRND